MAITGYQNAWTNEILAWRMDDLTVCHFYIYLCCIASQQISLYKHGENVVSECLDRWNSGMKNGWPYSIRHRLFYQPIFLNESSVKNHVVKYLTIFKGTNFKNNWHVLRWFTKYCYPLSNIFYCFRYRLMGEFMSLVFAQQSESALVFNRALHPGFYYQVLFMLYSKPSTLPMYICVSWCTIRVGSCTQPCPTSMILLWVNYLTVTC